MTQTVELVGGPADGMRLTLDPASPELHIPVFRPWDLTMTDGWLDGPARRAVYKTECRKNADGLTVFRFAGSR